jgi:hypothetical protein
MLIEESARWPGSIRGMANAWFFSQQLPQVSEREEEPVMSDQLKTYVAYIVGLSILMFGWSVFRTWEAPTPDPASVAQSASVSPRTVAPSRVAAE